MTARKQITTYTVVTKTVTLTFNEAHLRGVLGLPKNAELFVEAPRGGDCSGMDLGVDECGGLQVRWTERKEDESVLEEPQS